MLNNRDELIDKLASDIVEGMDLKSLMRYAAEMLADYYLQFSDEELEEALEEHFGCSIDDI